MQMDFISCYAIADCAARVFSEWRTSKHPGPDNAAVRKFLRGEAVTALRFLWKNGDASQRMTVFARVAIWMGRDAKGRYQHVLEREKQRLERKEKAA